MNRIEKALDNLLIRSSGDINSRIEQVSFDIEVKDTKAKGYCYCLKIDANGNIRLTDLIDYMDEMLIHYAIPKKELDEALEYQKKYGNVSRIIRLRKKANQLFTDLEKTGEGGEILLYILVQEYLKLPQLISKMSLKTSGQLHYQGADGIHVNYDLKNNCLNLYWGEAKMYKDISDAISACIKSLKDYLLEPYSYKSVQERDLQLLTANINSNTNDKNLENFLVRYFDKDDDLSNNLVYKGICLIGFDFEKYPNKTLGGSTTQIKRCIELELDSWYDKIGKQIKLHKNLEFKEIHVFLIPFPSVEEFRKYYLETIK